MMPLTNIIKQVELDIVDQVPKVNVTDNVRQTTSKTELAQYHHQFLFPPPVMTILKAIHKDQLKTFPRLENLLLKHLPTPTATLKGHMHNNRKGLQSTRYNRE